MIPQRHTSKAPYPFGPTGVEDFDALAEMAFDVAQVPAGQVVYIERRPMFVPVARTIGIHGIRHTDYSSARARLAARGLTPAA